MRSRAKRRPDESLARLARWLGFDRNPLRRGTDRVEGALRLVMIIVVVAVVPATAVAAGRWTDHYVLHQAQAQQAVDHQVTAVLLRDAPATGTPDPYTSVQTAWVPARWQPPGQPPRTGEVLAVAGARKGSTVRTWIDPSGAVTDPPLDHRVISRRRLDGRHGDPSGVGPAANGGCGRWPAGCSTAGGCAPGRPSGGPADRCGAGTAAEPRIRARNGYVARAWIAVSAIV